MKLKQVLRNPILLYILLFLVILNVLYFLQEKKTRDLILFILIGLIVYSVNENLIIVFSITLLISSCLLNNQMFKHTEGFEENEENKKSLEEQSTNNEIQDDNNVSQDDSPVVIDDNATLHSSYENLQKFLDSPGFAKLTNETHKLAKSQDKLMKSLSTLTPVLNDAKSSISNLDLSTYGSLSDIIMNLGKKTN